MKISTTEGRSIAEIWRKLAIRELTNGEKSVQKSSNISASYLQLSMPRSVVRIRDGWITQDGLGDE